MNMRTRTTTVGGFTTQLTRQEQGRSSCSASFSNVGSPQLTSVGTQTVKTITDVNTPGFYRILKCGKFLPLNPVVIETIRTTREGANNPHNTSTKSLGCQTGRWSPDMSWSALSPQYVTAPPFDESILAYLTNVAIADAKSAAWDALTSVSELHKTVDLVATRFRTLNNFAKKTAGKTKGKTYRQRLDSFSRAWLEYRYGWMPIVYDVQDIVTSFNLKLKKHDLVTGGSQNTVNLDISDSRVVNLSPSPSNQFRTETLTGTRTYRSRAYAEVISSSARLRGFDPVGTAWELTPYSFVIDWFIDINSYLQAVTPFAGASLLGCMNSVRDSYAYQQTSVTTWSGDDGVRIHSGQSGQIRTLIEVDRYTRFAASASLPVWNPRLNWKRAVDLLALILGGRSAVTHLITGR